MMNYKIDFSDEFKNQYRKFAKKNKQLITRIDKKLDDILDNPFIGKPLRYNLKGKFSVRVPPFPSHTRKYRERSEAYSGLFIELRETS